MTCRPSRPRSAPRVLRIQSTSFERTWTPTLAVVGELDPNREDVEAMAVEMTALQVIVIPNRDHGGVARSPQLRAATLDFLVKNRSQR